jgi:hypothetical protein
MPDLNQPCSGCRHAKMYACTQGRPAYPSGTPENCLSTKKRAGFTPVKGASTTPAITKPSGPPAPVVHRG